MGNYWRDVDSKFEQFAMKHLQELGIDYQSINMDEIWDATLCWDEQKSRFLDVYPSPQDYGPRQVEAEVERVSDYQTANYDKLLDQALALQGGSLTVYKHPEAPEMVYNHVYISQSQKVKYDVSYGEKVYEHIGTKWIEAESHRSAHCEKGLGEPATKSVAPPAGGLRNPVFSSVGGYIERWMSWLEGVRDGRTKTNPV